MKCNCNHDFQDMEYGSKLRVHTEGGTTQSRKYRCTACGSIKQTAPEKKKKEGEK